jgi:hypothetical protein
MFKFSKAFLEKNKVRLEYIYILPEILLLSRVNLLKLKERLNIFNFSLRNMCNITDIGKKYDLTFGDRV